MRNRQLAFAMMLAALAIEPARAQVTIDVSKITCEQYILWQVTDPQFIAIWLSGYYNGKRGNTVIDPQSLTQNAGKVRDYCRQNLKMPVMQAAETVVGAGK